MSAERIPFRRIEDYDPERQESLKDLEATLLALTKSMSNRVHNIVAPLRPVPEDAGVTEEALNRALDVLVLPVSPETGSLPVEAIAESIRSLVDSTNQEGVPLDDFRALMKANDIDLEDANTTQAILFGINEGLISLEGEDLVVATHIDQAA